MANNHLIEQLKNISNGIMNIDEGKLLRVSLGEAALENDFNLTLKEIQKKVALVNQYMHELHDRQLGDVVNILDHIRNEMEQQANRSSVDYVTNRDQFLNIIKTNLDELKLYWSPVVTAAVESRGFLEDEGVRQEYEQTIESIKKESESALQ